ncbi:MAG: hypothetical protein LW700_09835 [Gemmataceae bacterium]|nr:hypothetical protein [Gemmataceae bacterium]
MARSTSLASSSSHPSGMATIARLRGSCSPPTAAAATRALSSASRERPLRSSRSSNWPRPNRHRKRGSASAGESSVPGIAATAFSSALAASGRSSTAAQVCARFAQASVARSASPVASASSTCERATRTAPSLSPWRSMATICSSWGFWMLSMDWILFAWIQFLESVGWSCPWQPE